MKRVGFVGIPGTGFPTREILESGDCDIAFWCPDQLENDHQRADDTEHLVDLEKLAESSLIVMSTGIGRCRAVARRLGDVITGRHVLVHTVRGIEHETLNTASRIFYDETPTRRIGFVTGPMRLDDLRSQKAAVVHCASHFPEVHNLVDEAMVSPRIRIDHGRDLHGAELSAIYGRVLALLSGIADELDIGGSLRATLFSRGLAEMARFVASRGGDKETAFGLAGAGNLYGDTAYRGDVDFQMGRFIVEKPGRRRADLEEAFETPAREIFDILETFSATAKEADLSIPLVETVQALVDDRLEADRVLEHLLQLETSED